LPPAERPAYRDRLLSLLKPLGDAFVWCTSEREPGRAGPRVTRAEFEQLFAGDAGWHVNSVRPDRLPAPRKPGGRKAWLAHVTRVHGPDEVAENFGPAPAEVLAAALVAVTTLAPTPAAATTPAGLTGPFTEKLDPEPIAAAQQCPNWCWAAALE